ncbi:MAG: gas vesicle protein GvpG [Pseudomonadota bacterium]
MGLLRTLAALPVKGPMDATLWVATKLAEQVEQERNSPAALRAALAQAEQRLLAGELSEDDYDEIEDDLLRRLQQAPGA